jgi:drug/metabolite transporter (DMT)-like permease
VTSTVLEPYVIALVLFAALLHASWNAVVKSSADRLVSLGVVMLGGSILAVPFVFVLPFPGGAAFGWLLLSVVIHVFYYFFLLSAYAHGDLSHVYPIARGLGPLLVALVSAPVVGEVLAWNGYLGVALVSGGIFALSLSSRGAAFAWMPTRYAVLTGISIASYTIVDGLGVRASPSAFGYIAWLNFLEGPWLFVYAVWHRGAGVLVHLKQHARRDLAGSVVATIGYGIAIWAMSTGAMANVSALRESSVLIAALIGTLVLHEPFGRLRILASAVIVVGLVLMNLRLGA